MLIKIKFINRREECFNVFSIWTSFCLKIENALLSIGFIKQLSFNRISIISINIMANIF